MLEGARPKGRTVRIPEREVRQVTSEEFAADPDAELRVCPPLTVLEDDPCPHCDGTGTRRTE